MGEYTNEQIIIQEAARIVAAYVQNNTIKKNEISDLIREIHQTLESLAGGSQDSNVLQLKPKRESAKLVPAVPVKDSVGKDFIICLEDGKKLKMLKRHLKTTYNLTPEQYRKKWSLPLDYPMVAPNYASQRSALAKKIGLGTKNSKGSGKRKAS